jgi:hypothetical protein
MTGLGNLIHSGRAVGVSEGGGKNLIRVIGTAIDVGAIGKTDRTPVAEPVEDR